MGYLSVAGRSTFALDPIKGSRFIAVIDHVEDEEQAHAFIGAVRSEYADARHHCWAYRLHKGAFRSSDDGEPGGSAGRPILAQIDGHEVRDVAVVVVRWFGGVKLGVGGLIRAYGGCAGKGLDRATQVEVVPTTDVWIEHSYGDTAAVEAALASSDAVRVSADYGPQVRVQLRVPRHQLDDLRTALTDRTSGRVPLTDG